VSHSHVTTLTTVFPAAKASFRLLHTSHRLPETPCKSIASPMPILATEIFPANDRDKYVKYPAASQYHSKRPPDQSNLQSAGSSSCIRNRYRINRVSRRRHPRI